MAAMQGAAARQGRRSSVGCGVAQFVVRKLAVRRARFQFSALHPEEASLAEHQSDEDTKKTGLGI